jgi:hypothetical protein
MIRWVLLIKERGSYLIGGGKIYINRSLSELPRIREHHLLMMSR